MAKSFDNINRLVVGELNISQDQKKSYKITMTGDALKFLHRSNASDSFVINKDGSITLPVAVSSSPSSPASGGVVFIKSDGKLYFKNSSSIEYDLTTAAAGGGDITGVSAGVGLSGGGVTGDVTITLDVSELSALGTSPANSDYIVIEDVTDNSTKKVLVSNLIANTGDIQGVTAGTGLSGGGTSGTVSLATNDSAIVHDNLSGFVANEHIDHSTVSISSGAGLSGGGTIASNQTLTLDLASVISGDGENRILTSDGDGTLTAESKLTFDGTDLRLMPGADAGSGNCLLVYGSDTTSEYVGIGVKGAGEVTITAGGVNSTNTDMILRTAASGAETERMRITSDGRVFMGNPLSSTSTEGGGILTINKNDADAADDEPLEEFNLMISRETDDNNTEVGIGFRISTSQDSDGSSPGGAITFERTDSYSKGQLHFKTKGSATNIDTDTRMTISPEGNVDVITHNGSSTGLKLGGTLVTATAAELNYVDGVTSAIQTQMDTKAPIASPTFTGNTIVGDSLMVNTNAVGSGEMVRIKGDADAFNALVVFGTDTTTEYVSLGVKSGVPTITGGYTGTGDAALAFQTSDDSETERMRITAEGDILAGDYSGNSRTWTAVVFGSNWANLGGDYHHVKYRKDGFGNVHFKGVAEATHNNASTSITYPIFTLPAGYRPAMKTLISSAGSYIDSVREPTELRIETSGEVYLADSGDNPEINAWVSIDGVSFTLDSN